MRLYVSGPMTGIPEFNHPAFNAAAAQLRAAGFEVVNPAELDAQDAGKQLRWEDYLRRDIKALMDCDAIALLPNWTKSKGANLEVSIARSLSMPVLIVPGWLRVGPEWLQAHLQRVREAA